MHAVKVLTGAVVSALLLTPSAYAAGDTDGGFKITSGDFTFQLGGRIQFDTTWMNDVYLNGDGDNTEVNDNPRNDDDRWNSELRRTRIYVKGTFGPAWAYKLQYDLSSDAQTADGDTDSDVKDAYLDYSGWNQWTRIRIGQFKEPLGLNELTSSKNIVTNERSFVSDLFAPGRSQGISIRGNGNWGQNFLSYQLGGFINNASRNDDGGDVHAVTGRAVYARQFSQDEHRFLHLGLGASFRNQGDNEPDGPASTRLGVHLADKLEFANGRPFSDDSQLIVGEVAFNWQRWSAQGEYFFNSDNAEDDPFDNSDYEPKGYYVQAAYFITPDTRGYKYAEAVFDKVRPERGYGAWQVYLRWSDVDLSDGGRNDDEDATTLDVGVNWFLNNNIRFNLGYVRGETDREDVIVDGDDEDEGNAVTLRVQAAW